MPSPADLLAQRQASDLLDWAGAGGQAERRTPFERWRDRLSNDSLALLKAPGPTTAQDLLFHEAARLSYPIPDHLVETVAGLISAWGWDPLRILTYDEVNLFADRNRHSEVEDETFLEWLVFRSNPGPKTSLPAGLRWPVTLDGFWAFDAAHVPKRNQEWLMALTIASGANPWQRDDAGRAYLPFKRVLHRHPAIAVQLLELPGAPSATAALERYLSPADALKNDYGDGAELKEKMEAVLPYLLQALPDLRLGDDFLVHLPMNVLEAYVGLGRMDAPTSRRMEARSLERTSVEEQVTLKALLPTVGWDPAQAEVATVEAMTRHYVAKLGVSDCAFWEYLSQPKRLDQLMRPVSTDDGKGGWRLLEALAAFLLSRGLRELNAPRRIGCPAISWAKMMKDPLPSGALAPLLEGTVGNGLPVQGLWALALLGKRPEEGRDEQGQLIDTRRVDRSVESDLFGIDDWEEFSTQSLQSAVAATEWLIREGVDGDRLAEAWFQWIREFAWPGDQLGLLARVFAALGTRQYVQWGDQGILTNKPWAAFLVQAYDTLPVFQKPLREATEDEAPLLFEFGMALMHSEDLEEIQAWLARVPSTPTWVPARLRARVDGASLVQEKNSRAFSVDRIDALRRVLKAAEMRCAWPDGNEAQAKRL